MATVVRPSPSGGERVVQLIVTVRVWPIGPFDSRVGVRG